MTSNTPFGHLVQPSPANTPPLTCLKPHQAALGNPPAHLPARLSSALCPGRDPGYRAKSCHHYQRTFSPFGPLSSVPHLAPSPCPNQAPRRFAGPQTSSSLALGLRSSLRTHLAPLVGNPLVSDLTGPQVTSRAWTGFGPQLYPHPHLGPVAW